MIADRPLNEEFIPLWKSAEKLYATAFIKSLFPWENRLLFFLFSELERNFSFLLEIRCFTMVLEHDRRMIEA
jgi:hypothetical protein